MSTLLEKNPQCPYTIRDLYNLNAAARKIELNGRSTAQALIEDLNKCNGLYDIRVDGNGIITHLFFSFQHQIEMARRFPSVILLDCTYKTNKFRMPLLNIVGITYFYSTFFIGFAFMKEEKEDNYVWALSNLLKVFNPDQMPKVRIFMSVEVFKIPLISL